MIKIRKKLGKCVAMLLALIMVLTAPMTHMTVKADNNVTLAFTGFKNHKEWGIKPDQGSDYDVYLNTDVSVPGDSWGENFNIKATINGTEYTLECKKEADKTLFFKIPKDLIPYGTDATVVVKNGTYSDNIGNSFTVPADWTFYVSKHGMSTSDKILDANVTKDVICSINSDSTANGVCYTTNKGTNLAYNGNWGTRSKPAINRFSSDNTLYYWTNHDKYGLKKDDAFVGLDEGKAAEYQAYATFNINLTETSNYIALSDMFGEGNVQDGVYTLTGVFCDSQGNLTEYNEFRMLRKTTDGVVTYVDDSYTKVEPSGFFNVYENGDWSNGVHNLYIKTSTTLPSTAWNLFAKIKVEINGKEVEIEMNKYNDNAFYLPISGTDMPYGEDATVVIKAGRYSAHDGEGNPSGKIYFDKDWTFYASKYGVSTSNSILDANIPKVNVTLGTEATGDAGYNLYPDKSDKLVQDWTTEIKPVKNNISTDTAMYYYHGENANNGYKFNGVKQDATMKLKHPGNNYFVGLQDVYGAGEAPAGTYELCGAYCDPSGNIVVFNPYEVTRVHDGDTVRYEEKLNIDYTQFTLSDIYDDNDESKYTGNRYDTYIKPSVDLSAIPNDTAFNGLKLQVGNNPEVNITAYKAGHMNSFFFMADENIIPKDVAKGTKITIKKGKAVSSNKKLGIELTEDYVMYALGDAKGFTTERPLDCTAFKFTGLSKDISLDKNSNTWHMYIPTDAEALPGVAWNDRFTINLEIGGEIVKVDAMQSNNANEVYFPLSTDKLPTDTDSKFVIKAGKYACNTADKTIAYEIKEDFTVYTSKYGCSTNDSVWASKAVKVGFTLAAESEQQWENRLVALSVTSDDGIEPDASWNNKAYPVTKGRKVGETVFVETYAGLQVNGEDIKVEGDTLLSLSKTHGSIYAVALQDISQTAVVGKEYTIGGMYYSNVDGHLIDFAPITVTWDGTKWSKVSKNLDDTGVEADVNGDNTADVRDLIRLVHYIRVKNNPDVNANRLDINHDNSIDELDIPSIRKVLLGYVSYKESEGGASATPSGTPSYSKKNKIEVLAYSCPDSGTLNDGVFTVSDTLDDDLKAYKEAGFTLLLSEFEGVLKDNHLNETTQAELVAYLKAAQRQGLGVIVCSEYINTLLIGTDADFDEKVAGTDKYKWEEVLSQYIEFLNKYPAFKGFMMADELQIKYVDNYRRICNKLKELKPDINLHSSQLPVEAYTNETLGPGSLTTDTVNNDTKEKAYKDYVTQFGQASGHFTFDLYGLIATRIKLTNSFVEHGVKDDWYKNLQWASEVIKDNYYSMSLGVTVQSCSIYKADDNLISVRYPPEKKSDIGFQIYTAMAYGAKEINYFTYQDHPTDGTVNDAMQDNSKVREAVVAVNKEVASFGYVFKSFNWKDTLDIAKGGSNNSTGNARLASVSATGGRTFVGCMKDVDGFDGYMVANAEGPRTSNNATVTMKFNNASSVTVYKGETSSKVNITGGVYTLNLNVGEGAFVIPNYN